MSKAAKTAMVVLGVYALLSVVVYATCSWQLCFEESIGTFYYNSGFIASTAAGPGGISRLVAMYLVQWCVTPLAASLVVGALLTLVFALLAAAARKVAGNWLYTPLVLVPVCCLAIVQTDIDYRLDGTVAFAFMSAGLLAYLMVERTAWRVAAALAACAAVWWLGVQVAILLAALVVLIELIKAPRTSMHFLLCPLAVWGICLISVHCGLYPDVEEAMSPGAYILGRDELDIDPWPWMTIVPVVIALALLSKKRKYTPKGRVTAVICGIVAAVALTSYAYFFGDMKQSTPFLRQAYYLNRGDMDGVVHAYEPNDMYASAMRNMLNLALAEKGQLASVMLRYADQDPASLYVTRTYDRYQYFTLSDIFWSMGLIGSAQRYAFEANESVGNLSPRMLKRLVDTNLVNGNYEVAEKYINLLADTHYYSDFANERRALLYDDDAVKAHPQLGPKQACRIADNRFAAYLGIDNDLLQVLRANPSHSTTMQYLGMLQLLRRNVPAFMELMEEFHGTPTLPDPLPEHFQEAVAVASLVDDNNLYVKYRVHPSVVEKCKAFWQRREPAPNTLWHYMRQASETSSDDTPAATDHGE